MALSKGPRALAWAMLFVLLGAAYAETEEELYAALEKFVVSNGGQVRAKVGYNSQGYRGLFARELIKAGEPIVSVPGTCLINAGAVKGSPMTPTLILLREQLNPHSRMKPYLDVLPAADSVMGACTWDKSVWPLFESKHWENFFSGWQNFIHDSVTGDGNHRLEFTVEEVLGNVTGKLTLLDFKRACALVATRYVDFAPRGRLFMIPIFDMCNHRRGCQNHIRGTEDQKGVNFIAAQDIEEGEEICVGYGSMRDDYAVSHYGFLPDLEDPPRLLEIDHHQFNPQESTQHFTEELFNGTPEELEGELKRLKGIQATLKKNDDNAKATGSRPARGTSPETDMLLDMQARRRGAIDHQILRIQDLIAKAE